MLNYITKPDSSKYTTIKLFQGMIDELKRARTEEEFQLLIQHALFISKKDIQDLNFTHEQFRRLISFYLQDKYNHDHIQEEIKFIN